jgi:hypothetical protein
MIYIYTWRRGKKLESLLRARHSYGVCLQAVVGCRHASGAWHATGDHKSPMLAETPVLAIQTTYQNPETSGSA